MIGSLKLLLFYVKTDDCDLNLVALFCLAQSSVCQIEHINIFTAGSIHYTSMIMRLCHLSVTCVQCKYKMNTVKWRLFGTVIIRPLFWTSSTKGQMNKVLFCHQSTIHMAVIRLRIATGQKLRCIRIHARVWYKVSPVYTSAIPDVSTSKQELLVRFALFHLKALKTCMSKSAHTHRFLTVSKNFWRGFMSLRDWRILSIRIEGNVNCDSLH